ncbi:MAG: putative quinol monooxygenase [Planctomycetota bacterium]
MAAPTEEAPLIGLIRDQLKGHTGPFTMLVHFYVESGREDDFVDAFAPGIAGTRAEPRNLRYELNRDPDNGNHFMLYERWPDLDALVTHTEQPHYAALGEAVGPLQTQPLEIDVMIAYVSE